MGWSNASEFGREEPTMVPPSTLPPLVRGEWIPMSWEEFLAWSSEEGKFEWVDGEGIAYVSNSDPHVRIGVFLAELLGLYLRVFAHGRLFVDQMLLRLPTRPSGRMPDLFVLGRDDLDRVHHQWVDGPARLAVEIVSEDSVERDTREKREEYERAGVTEYLTIDARPGRDEFIYLRRDAAGHYQPVEPDEHGRYHSTALPGLWLDPYWFWKEPPPDPEDLLLAMAPGAYEAWMLVKLRARRAAAGTP
jgi:Uma2 family endonuclease